VEHFINRSPYSIGSGHSKDSKQSRRSSFDSEPRIDPCQLSFMDEFAVAIIASNIGYHFSRKLKEMFLM